MRLERFRLSLHPEKTRLITTWRRHVARVGRLLDDEAHHRLTSQPTLNEFGLPIRNPLRAIGIDGGYVRASDAESRQEGWFEVMVGKSLPREGSDQVFAFVHRFESKPSERMERFLAEQGVFPAQYAGSWELPVIGVVPGPTAVLIRPDGYVGWVGDLTQLGLAHALTTWFGPPTAE